MSRPKAVLSVRVDQSLIEKLDALAERTGEGRADLVERALAIGLMDQEEYVAWFEDPIKSPLMRLLTHPKVLTAFFKMTGGEVDEMQQRIKKTVSSRRRTKPKRGTQ